MGNAILPEEATIYIGANTLDTSVVMTSTYAVTAEVTNFSESGGEEDIEPRVVFGGGNINLTKPRSQLEVSFDVILRYNSDYTKILRWDSFKSGAIQSSSYVDIANDAVAQQIYVQFTNGTEYYTLAYRDAKAVTFEPEASSEDLLKGTMTFKLSPTDADGNGNKRIWNVAATSTNWT